MRVPCRTDSRIKRQGQRRPIPAQEYGCRSPPSALQECRSCQLWLQKQIRLSKVPRYFYQVPRRAAGMKGLTATSTSSRLTEA